MNRKGGTIILAITIFAVFIPVAMFVQTLNASNTLENAVDYRSGDIGVLARSQIQKQNLEGQYQKGLNYSLNEQAFKKGSFNEWRTIPDISEIEISYVEDVQRDLETRFNTQKLGCDADTMPVLAQDIEEGDYVIQTSGRKVTCARSHSEAKTYFTSDLEVENPKNRFIILADYTIRASQNFKEEISGNEVEGEGSASGSCGQSRSSVRSSAVSDAKDTATSGLSYGSGAVSATEDVEDTSVEQTTTYSGSGTAEITDSSECCEETEMVKNEKGEREVICVEEDMEYDAEGEFTASTAEFDLKITDDENELVYSGGKENLDYNVKYIYSFN